jgi:hypothetical protein
VQRMPGSCNPSRSLRESQTVRASRSCAARSPESKTICPKLKVRTPTRLGWRLSTTCSTWSATHCAAGPRSLWASMPFAKVSYRSLSSSCPYREPWWAVRIRGLRFTRGLATIWGAKNRFADSVLAGDWRHFGPLGIWRIGISSYTENQYNPRSGSRSKETKPTPWVSITPLQDGTPRASGVGEGPARAGAKPRRTCGPARATPTASASPPASACLCGRGVSGVVASHMVIVCFVCCDW